MAWLYGAHDILRFTVSESKLKYSLSLPLAYNLNSVFFTPSPSLTVLYAFIFPLAERSQQATILAECTRYL